MNELKIIMMKYKKGDKVRVKSLEWFNINKGNDGDVLCDNAVHFTPDMTPYCSKIVTISKVFPSYGYYILEPSDNIKGVFKDYIWTNEMFEGFAEPDIKITIAIPTDSVLKKDSIRVEYNEESNKVILTADKEITYKPRVGNYVTMLPSYSNTPIKAIIMGISDSNHLTYIKVSTDSSYDICECDTSLTKINLATPEEKQVMDTILSYCNVIWNPTKYKLEKKRWRAKKLESYYYVTDSGRIEKATENTYNWNNDHYQFGNYFRTEQQAKDKVEQLKNFFQSSE